MAPSYKARHRSQQSAGRRLSSPCRHSLEKPIIFKHQYEVINSGLNKLGSGGMKQLRKAQWLMLKELNVG